VTVEDPGQRVLNFRTPVIVGRTLSEPYRSPYAHIYQPVRSTVSGVDIGECCVGAHWGGGGAPDHSPGGGAVGVCGGGAGGGGGAPPDDSRSSEACLMDHLRKCASNQSSKVRSPQPVASSFRRSKSVLSHWRARYQKQARLVVSGTGTPCTVTIHQVGVRWRGKQKQPSGFAQHQSGRPCFGERKGVAPAALRLYHLIWRKRLQCGYHQMSTHSPKVAESDTSLCGRLATYQHALFTIWQTRQEHDCKAPTPILPATRPRACITRPVIWPGHRRASPPPSESNHAPSATGRGSPTGAAS
jgi:hypothetical protein